ncbi:MAG: hypothetical protein U9N40_05350 [Euryarchaeota archaeon]|nr:hypothetical protein [Euryarchaeota archaeon]
MSAITDGLSELDVILAITSSEDLRESVMESITTLCKSGFFGIVISINEPWSILKKELNKRDTEISNLFFIDCVTISAIGQIKDESNCIYINNPAQLTSIGIALTKAMGAMKDKDKENLFIVIDSINTMFVYNDPNQILRFLHMFTNKVRLNSAKSIMFSVKNAIDPIVSAQLGTISDLIVNPEAENAQSDNH